MALKHPTVASSHFKYSSNDQDKPSPSTSGENTDACSPLIPDARGPQKTLCISWRICCNNMVGDYNKAGFSPEIFEGVVAFGDVIKLGSITNVTQSAT